MYDLKTTLSKALLASLGAGIIALSVSASAQAGEVGNRFDREQARIGQGVRSGELTWHEYRNDERGLDRIEAQRRRDLRDGALSPRERARLNLELNRESEHVYFTKHDRRDQPGR